MSIDSLKIVTTLYEAMDKTKGMGIEKSSTHAVSAERREFGDLHVNH